MRSCSLAFMLVIVGMVFGSTDFAAAVEAKRPNVLFIISDDLSASALSCYGNTQCKTPHIDRVAKRGVRFTRAYCQYPVCGPSRASLMASMYPQATGVMGNGASSRFTQNMGKRQTMSQLFKDHGYYAARVSKIYHMRVPGDITAGVDGPDHAASWTERFNCPGPEQWTKGEHSHLSGERLKPDPKRSIHYSLGYGGAFYVVKASKDAARQPDALAADKAIELMKAKSNAKAPFFLAVGLVRPHVPLVAPSAYFDPYPPKQMKLMPAVENDQADIPQAGLTGTTKQRKITKPRAVLSAYYASVAFMDAQVGRMLDALKELGLEDNTIVVFCSDHGYHLGEHDKWQKMSMHEESARIPLLIAAPKGANSKRGVTSGSLAEQIDIYPTLADLAGLKAPAHVQGKSLAKTMANPEHEVRDAAYCTKGNAHLLRTKQWAYITYTKRRGDSAGDPNGIELYDMQKDPRQFTNLAKSKQHAEAVKTLHGQLLKKLASISK